MPTKTFQIHIIPLTDDLCYFWAIGNDLWAIGNDLWAVCAGSVAEPHTLWLIGDYLWSVGDRFWAE